MRTSLAVLVVLVATSTARAGELETRSPAVATAASVGTTLGALAAGIAMHDDAGLAIATAGLVLGPSAGHWYAGDAGIPGLVLRGAGMGLMALTVDAALGCSFGDGSDEVQACGDASKGFVVGAGLVVGGMLYDFATAGRSARRARGLNTRTVQLAPTTIAGPHSRGPGVELDVRF